MSPPHEIGTIGSAQIIRENGAAFPALLRVHPANPALCEVYEYTPEALDGHGGWRATGKLFTPASPGATSAACTTYKSAVDEKMNITQYGSCDMEGRFK